MKCFSMQDKYFVYTFGQTYFIFPFFTSTKLYLLHTNHQISQYILILSKFYGKVGIISWLLFQIFRLRHIGHWNTQVSGVVFCKPIFFFKQEKKFIFGLFQQNESIDLYYFVLYIMLCSTAFVYELFGDFILVSFPIPICSNNIGQKMAK